MYSYPNVGVGVVGMQHTVPSDGDGLTFARGGGAGYASYAGTANLNTVLHT